MLGKELGRSQVTQEFSWTGPTIQTCMQCTPVCTSIISIERGENLLVTAKRLITVRVLVVAAHKSADGGLRVSFLNLEICETTSMIYN
jgi:hypothetical protein